MTDAFTKDRLDVLEAILLDPEVPHPSARIAAVLLLHYASRREHQRRGVIEAHPGHKKLTKLMGRGPKFVEMIRRARHDLHRYMTASGGCGAGLRWSYRFRLPPDYVAPTDSDDDPNESEVGGFPSSQSPPAGDRSKAHQNGEKAHQNGEKRPPDLPKKPTAARENKPSEEPSEEPIEEPSEPRATNQLTLYAEVEKSPARQIEEAFDRWWTAYPAKVGKKDAKRRFARIVTEGIATADQMISAAAAYATTDKVRRGYAKNPATWLNGEHWLDEPSPSPSPFPASDPISASLRINRDS